MMATAQKSKASTDREKWGKILNGLVLMLRTQQKQIESLLEERKLLEDRINKQYERSVYDVRLYKDQISQMKREFLIQDLLHSRESTKGDFMMGLKQKEAFLYKLKLRDIDNQLADFRMWFDYLSHKCSNAEDISQENFRINEQVSEGGKDGYLLSENGSRREDQCVKTMESELKRLKRDYDKLSSENSNKIAALFSERNFVWKQYEKMENEYSIKLKGKVTEVEIENEKIEKLLTSMEQLQSTNNTKDETIVRLKAEVAKLEADKNKKDEEIFRLSGELELSKKSRIFFCTPVLNRHTVEPRNSNGGKKRSMDGIGLGLKKELYASRMHKHVKNSKKGCRS